MAWRWPGDKPLSGPMMVRLPTHTCVTRPQWVKEARSHKSWTGFTWWRHQMETFSALLAICVGNSLVTGEFPAQRPVTRSFEVFFDLRLNKRLSKQRWGWWFETPSRPLCRQSNEPVIGAMLPLNVLNHFGSYIYIYIHIYISDSTVSSHWIWPPPGRSDWIIPSFRILDYVLHVEHVSCVITNCGQHQWVIPSPALYVLPEENITRKLLSLSWDLFFKNLSFRVQVLLSLETPEVVMVTLHCALPPPPLPPMTTMLTS